MTITKLLNIFVTTTLLICSTGVGNVFSQERRITCESRNRDYNYCSVDTDNNVRLVRKNSFWACNEGSSWGYDRRGIWVDRGCSAEFAYGNDGSNKTAAIVAGSVIGGAILAGVLASRKKEREKYNDSTSVYNLGFSQGLDDAKSDKNSDPGRYRDKYNSNFESDFTRGYYDGYRNNPSNSGNQSQAYNTGYQRGINDSIQNLRSDYRRYDNLYNFQTENDFRHGYEDGYKNNQNESFYRNDENNRVPNWAVGTFRAYSSRTRQSIDITIYADGRVWKRGIGGSNTENGTYSSGYLFIAGTNYRVTKSNNGGFFAQNLSDSSENLFYARLY